MKRLIALIVLILAVFYIAWPSWTAYQIATAIKGKDAATLERKIDFNSVRGTLRPLAETKISELYDKFQSQAGPAAAVVIGQIKKDVIPRVAETALASLVTAPNLIRVVSEGGTIKQNAEKILQEQVGKTGLPGVNGAGGAGPAGGLKLPGGLGGIAAGGLGEIAGKLGLPGLGGSSSRSGTASSSPVTTVPTATEETPTAPQASAQAVSYGLGNIKTFGFLGPLAFEIGIAKDQASTAPDVVTEMRFIGGDWKVTGVRPRI